MNDSNILVSVKNKVQLIQLNRPRKKNAINKSMYVTLTNLLNEAANDDGIAVSVLTGSGDYYSSGNDIQSFSSASDNPILEAKNMVRAFVEAFINYPKILIAIINGPAIGIAATTLALCDVVYASENAYVQTPFTRLGLSPEGCSSYTFPRMFGPSKASEILLFGQKLTMDEAVKFGLVSEVYSSNDMLEKIWNKIYSLPSLPQESLMHSKKILKNFDKEYLMLANINECNELEARWKSEEFLSSVMNFANRVSKL